MNTEVIHLYNTTIKITFWYWYYHTNAVIVENIVIIEGYEIS